MTAKLSSLPHPCTEVRQHVWLSAPSTRLHIPQLQPHCPALTTQVQEPGIHRVVPPWRFLSPHRVEVQQDVGPIRLKVAHVTVRERGQLQGRGQPQSGALVSTRGR